MMPLTINTRRLVILGLLFLWCTLLVVLGIHRTGSTFFGFLLWNLFLAALPLLAGAAFKTKGFWRFPPAAFLAFSCWLLFLPNAPYLLTDLLHLSPQPSISRWYDMMVLLSCAGTGLLFGYLSLIDVHLTVEEHFGRVAGWLTAVTSLFLCGFGIYLGRFLRWNSWEALTNPTGIFADVAHRILRDGAYSLPVEVTLIFGTALLLGYAALRVVATSYTLGR